MQLQLATPTPPPTTGCDWQGMSDALLTTGLSHLR